MRSAALPLRRRAIAVLAVLAMAVCVAASARSAAIPTGEPQYDATGKLLMPTDYREWVFLSSGVDMSYSHKPAMASGHMFDNVFAPPAAYAAFKRDGIWPDRTVLILENRGAANKGSINTLGLFQTDEVMAVEAHVKDRAHFAGGWGFFAFDATGPATVIPASATCYACHLAHAAADTTFVQFYPLLLPVAARHGTLNPAYVAAGGLAPAR